MNVLLRLTRSQHMALSSLLVEYMQMEGATEEFIDVASEVTTTPGELLSMITPLTEIEHDNTLAALVESVKLQSHYAEQLNVYDSGERMQFASAAEWIRRLYGNRPTEPEPTHEEGG